MAAWRKGWDSNPRGAYTPGGFQDRCLKPLGHPSVATISMALAHIPDRTFFEHRAVCYRFATIFALAKRSVDGCRSSPVASSISIRWAKCVRPQSPQLSRWSASQPSTPPSAPGIVNTEDLRGNASGIKCPRDRNTQVGVPAVVEFPPAVGRAEVPCIIEVGTAAIDTLTAINRDQWRTVRRCPIVVIFIAIFDPLQCVAMCVV